VWCRVLQCVALCGIVWQCVAVCGNVWKFVVVMSHIYMNESCHTYEGVMSQI